MGSVVVWFIKFLQDEFHALEEHNVGQLDGNKKLNKDRNPKLKKRSGKKKNASDEPDKADDIVPLLHESATEEHEDFEDDDSLYQHGGHGGGGHGGGGHGGGHGGHGGGGHGGHGGGGGGGHRGGRKRGLGGGGEGVRGG